MNVARRSLAISTVAWVGLAVAIVVIAGFAAYYGSYSAVKASSPNPSTTTVVQLEVSDSTVTYTTTVTPSSSCIDLCSNILTVTLSSATLYGGKENAAIGGSSGSSYIAFALDNPGYATTITGFFLTGSGISSVSNWETSGGVSYSTSNNNALPASQVTSFTFYPYGTAQSLTTGQVYNYVIDFANGQSVSGSLIAQ